jgi:hypothetical protein
MDALADDFLSDDSAVTIFFRTILILMQVMHAVSSLYMYTCSRGSSSFFVHSIGF